ncbi:MAG: hypothetical protein AAB329_00615 [Pseudomonadota bacterium]
MTKLQKQMYHHARNLEIEQAPAVRDRLATIRTGKFGIVQNVARK